MCIRDRHDRKAGAGGEAGEREGRQPVIGAAQPGRMVSVNMMGEPRGGAAERGGARGKRARERRQLENAPKGPKGLALHDIAHPGFELEQGATGAFCPPAQADAAGVARGLDEMPPLSEICFNCWSAGKGASCVLHKSNDGAGKRLRASESALMCKNWDLSLIHI